MLEKRLKIYKDGSRAVTGGAVSMWPIGVEPVEEYNLDNLREEELEELRKKPFDKELIKKAKKIK